MADYPLRTVGPEFRNIFGFDPSGGRSVSLEKKIVRLRISALERALRDARVAYEDVVKQADVAVDAQGVLGLLDKAKLAGVALDEAEGLLVLAEKYAKERGLLAEQDAPTPPYSGRGMSA